MDIFNLILLLFIYFFSDVILSGFFVQLWELEEKFIENFFKRFK